MLTEQAIKLIQDSAVKAHGQRIFPIPGDEFGRYYVLNDGGELELNEPIVDRTARARDIATVVAFAGSKDFPEIWYSRDGVISCNPDSNDFCKLSLVTSKPFQWLETADKTGGLKLTQAQLYRLIRTLLGEALVGAADVLQLVRKVDIKKAQEASGTIAKGSVSMGRSMIAEASGASSLPDYLTFAVPVFDSASVTTIASVRAAFDLDPQTEQFSIDVLPGEIERAYAKAEADILESLMQQLSEQSVDIPVYYGSPE